MTAPDAPPSVLAGRYVLGAELGRGGGGVVVRATDRVTGDAVAVKTLLRSPGVDAPRIHREIAALRLLRIPGVVMLRDAVFEESATHLVMELVEGAPFPGPLPERTWEPVAPRVRALLETLARIHAAGVIHRDVKPANVVVGPGDRVTLLDFGISWGAALGGPATLTGTIVGTPEFLAPEQLRGRGVDGRTDLYAVGVMLYETFTGRLPFDAQDFATLIERKLSGEFQPLERRVPTLPRSVARTIDALLRVNPDDRPQSAREALHRLFGAEGTDPAVRPLRRLGPAEPLDLLLAAARAGRPADVHGPRGSGRSRILRDAAAALAAEGRRTVFTGEGRAPFSSLEPVVGTVEGDAARSRDAAVEAIRARLAEVLARGDVVLVDDPRSVDRWSAETIAACRSAGALLRVVAEPTPGCVVLEPWTAEDLRSVFSGPSRLLHVPEDGAQELWDRTGGHAGLVSAELAAWVRAGLAVPDGDRVAVSRGTLDRLRGGLPVATEAAGGAMPNAPTSPELEEMLAWLAMAWPYARTDRIAAAAGMAPWLVESVVASLVEDGAARALPDGRVLPLVAPRALHAWPEERRQEAHRALAAAAPVGTLERLRHVAAAGESRAAVDEALAVARSLADLGRAGEARAAADLALSAAREIADAGPILRVLEAVARIALSLDTTPAVEDALHAVRHSRLDDPRAERLEDFLEAVLGALRGGGAPALERLARAAPLDDLELETARWALRARFAERGPLEPMRAVVEEFGAWAAARSGPGAGRAAAAHRDAVAALRLREGRPGDAADLYLAAAAEDVPARVRTVALLNAGTALLDSGRLDDAARIAEQARAAAAAGRHCSREAFAESLLRDVLWRSGRAAAPDADLVEAVGSMGLPDLASWVALTEAAVAWRTGSRDAGRALAARAQGWARDVGRGSLALLARALEVACGGAASADEVASLREAFLGDLDPAEAVQALSLVAGSGAPGASALARDAVRLAAGLAPGDLDAPREILPLREAVDRVSGLL